MATWRAPVSFTISVIVLTQFSFNISIFYFISFWLFTSLIFIQLHFFPSNNAIYLIITIYMLTYIFSWILWPIIILKSLILCARIYISPSCIKTGYIYILTSEEVSGADGDRLCLRLLFLSDNRVFYVWNIR